MASEQLHEPAELLRPETIEMHRAIVSLMEELEAVDWYAQRVDAASDAELKEILDHNRKEEIEHFTMVLEWLRRRDQKFSDELKNRLFTEGSIVAQEQEGKEPAAAAAPSSDGSLGIGSLKGGDTL